MRTFLVALAAVLFATTSYAEPCTIARAAVDASGCTEIVALELSRESRFSVAQRLADEAHQAVVVRNTGIALTALGTIATVAGAVLWSSTICFDDCPDDPNGDLKSNAGIGLLVVGQASAVAGISMWAAGGAKASKLSRALLSVGPMGATVRF